MRNKGNYWYVFNSLQQNKKKEQQDILDKRSLSFLKVYEIRTRVLHELMLYATLD